MTLTGQIRASLLALCWLTGMLLTVPLSAAPSGISFGVLRVIYTAEDKKGVTLTLRNHSEAPYLIQTWVRPVDPRTGNVALAWNGAPIMPFVITPPLARLEAGSELTLRIRRNDVPLPADRESVFFISIKALPPGSARDNDRMVMTVVSNLKLFYRPKGLAKRAIAEVAGSLRFRREGDTLIASNPTPYWLTFSHLKVGNRTLDNATLRLMVPPGGEQHYSLPPEALGPVTWQLIDEDGWNTPAAQQEW